MSKEQIIILCVSIFVAILLLVAIIYFFIYPLIRKKYMYRNFKFAYYKKIYKITEYNDFLLVNNVNLRNNEDLIISRIDHIMVGKKYIYIIKDKFYRGAINGNREDNTWLFFDAKNNKKEISNPMKKNEERVKNLCALTRIDQKLCISIVLINDDCVIKDPKALYSNNSFIISNKGLNKLIKSIEKRDIKPLDQVSSEQAVNEIYRIYGRGREE